MNRIRLLETLKKNYVCKSFYPLLVSFLLILTFSIWSNPSLKPHISGDGYGYWSIAEDFTIKEASIRPFLFPLILKVIINFSPDNWQFYFTLFQLISHSLISSFLFLIYKKCSFSDFSAFICTLAIGFNPNLIYYSSCLLADILLAILTTISWFFLFYINSREEWNKNLMYLLSFFCGLCIVTKPVALLMIFPIFLSMIIVKNISIEFLKILPLFIIINFSFHIIWETYKNQHHEEKTIVKSDLIFGAINWTAIKSGLIEKGRNTPLYNILLERNQIERAKKLKTVFSYTMDENPEFLVVFRSLHDNWAIKSDNEFAKKVFKDSPLEIILFSAMKWHSFFTKRGYSPPYGSFPKMPRIVKIIYVKLYAYLYRPFLLFLLIGSVVLLLSTTNKNLLYSSFFIILYASAVVNFASASASEFARYRVWIEYIMWFCAFYPIGFFLTFLQKYRKTLGILKLNE